MFTGAGSCCPIMGRQDPGLSPWPYTSLSGFPLPPGLTPRREVVFTRPSVERGLQGFLYFSPGAARPCGQYDRAAPGEALPTLDWVLIDENEDRGIGSCRIPPDPTPPCCLTPNKAPVKLSTSISSIVKSLMFSKPEISGLRGQTPETRKSQPSKTIRISLASGAGLTGRVSRAEEN